MIRYLLIFLFLLLCVNSLFSQKELSKRENTVYDNFILARDNVITGIALEGLGGLVVVSNLKTKNPTSKDVIYGVGYGFIGTGVFYLIKSVIRIRKAGKMLQGDNGKIDKNLYLVTSGNGVSLIYNF